MNSALIAAIVASVTLSVVLLALLLRAKKGRQRLLAELSEAKREQTVAQLERDAVVRSKDTFVSAISHDLRTPLTSARGALSLLQTGLLGNNDPKAQNLLRIALTNTDRLIRIVNDTLDLERIQSGRAPLQIQLCSLSTIARNAIQLSAAAASAVQVEFKLEIEHDSLQDSVDADPSRLLQIINHLLENAIKFSPPSSVIRIHIESQKTDLLLRVIDSGQGIPADKLESIFERFQQVDTAEGRQADAGLGLPLSRAIARQLGGNVWAERGDTAGATVTLSLPRAKAAVIRVISQPSITSMANSVIPSTAMETPCILICDDDPDVRILIRDLLERRGYTVVETARGEQAIAFAMQHPVDAILLDPQMPGLSGWESLQQLRRSHITREIPLIVASVLSPSDRQAIATDPQLRMQKPVDDKSLFTNLISALAVPNASSNVSFSALLVEDHEEMATVVQLAFEQVGITPHRVTDGASAIESCQQHTPKIILLDLSLSDNQAFSFAAWLREHPKLRSVPVVAYSRNEIADFTHYHATLTPTQLLTKAKISSAEIDSLVIAILGQLPAKQVTEAVHI